MGALTTVLVAAALSSPAAAAPQGVILHAGGPTAVKDSYVVVLKDTTALRSKGVPAATRELAARHHGTAKLVYQKALRGFSVTMSETDARALAAESAVSYVEQDHVVHLAGTQTNPPSWGLDRIDQRNLPLNSSYSYPNDGAGVHVYIIDTGVRFSHATFGGRATSGFDAIDGGPADDCNGHGTHVSGTVGGTEYGVAKGVSIVGVRVLNCQGSGTTAQVVAGIDWVTANAIKPAVANMSLGGGADTALDNAVANSISAGISYGIAAGNGNAAGIGIDACTVSPARVPAAITVGATQITDARATFSNFGTCVDIFGPGVNITSSWNTSDTATNSISGTSMATPHVVGAAAVWLAAHPGSTPQQVRAGLVADSTPGKVTNPGAGSPNRLLFVNQGGTGTTVTVTNPGSQTGSVGAATSLQIQATSTGGGTLTYAASGLPAGLSINSGTGRISGTPTTAGTSSVTVTATDAGASGTATFNWTINQVGGCGSPGQKLLNPGFEAGARDWSQTGGVINSSGLPAHRGSWKAWLNGLGTTHTDTLSQTVTIPAGCTSYRLSFFLHITTDETSTVFAYDTLRLTIGTRTLGTWSNLTANPTYVKKSFNMARYAGQTVTILFTGTEDFSAQTSFLIDDTALKVT